MARIEIDIGEAVVITFKGTDGEITVAFSDPAVRILTGCDEELAAKLQALGGIVVHADLADTTGRDGIVYHEPMGTPEEKELVSEHGVPVPRNPHT